MESWFAPGSTLFAVATLLLAACSSAASTGYAPPPAGANADGGAEESAPEWTAQRDADGCLVPPRPSKPVKLELSECSYGTCLRWEEAAEAYKAYEDAALVGKMSDTCASRLRTATTTYDFYVGEDSDPGILAEEVSLGEGGVSRGMPVAEDGLFEAHLWALPRRLEPFGTFFVRIVVKNPSGSADSSVVELSNGEDLRCPGAKTVTDVSGNTYDTVQVGNQCWLARDLRAGKTVSLGGTTSQSDNQVPEKGCSASESGAADCAGLYTWNELTGYEGSSPSLCPTGWHLPSANEWLTMLQHADHGRVSLVYRKPVQSSGVTVSGPAGSGNYWTATEKTTGLSGTASTMVVYLNKPDVAQQSYNKSHRVAARCVKN